MQLTELPLEIQHAIFETLVLGGSPKEFIRARLASSYFAAQIQDAFVRRDECFEVYVHIRRGRTTSNISPSLESAYLRSRLSTGRPFVQCFDGTCISPERLASLVNDAQTWDQNVEGAPQDHALTTLTTRLLDTHYSVRDLLKRTTETWEKNDPSYCYDLLCAAAALGHLDVVQKLLAAGVDAFSRVTDASWLPLRDWHRGMGCFGFAPACAARFGHLEILKTLLGSYISKTAPEKMWQSIITDALKGGHNHCVEFVLGQDVTCWVSSTGTLDLFRTAVGAGNMEGARILMEHTYEDFPPRRADEQPELAPSDNNDEDKDNEEAPWHWIISCILDEACTVGSLEFTQFALDHWHPSHSEHPDWFFGPASAAAWRGHIQILDLLLTKAMKRHNSLKVIIVPSRGYFGQHPFSLAIQSGDIAIVQKLLDHGAVIDTTLGGSWGDTPLKKAICLGYADIVDLLLAKGASLTFAGATKWMKHTAYTKKSVWNEAHLMTTAAFHNHGDVIRVLGRYGVSPLYPYTKPQRFQAISHDPMLNALRAARSGKRDAVEALVELGAADPGEVDPEIYLAGLLEPKERARKRKIEEFEEGRRNGMALRPRRWF